MTVEELLREAQHLDRSDQQRLLDGLVRLLAAPQPLKVSVTALRGLGRDLWDGTDAQEYVNRERDSWGG